MPHGMITLLRAYKLDKQESICVCVCLCVNPLILSKELHDYHLTVFYFTVCHIMFRVLIFRKDLAYLFCLVSAILEYTTLRQNLQ